MSRGQKNNEKRDRDFFGTVPRRSAPPLAHDGSMFDRQKRQDGGGQQDRIGIKNGVEVRRGLRALFFFGVVAILFICGAIALSAFLLFRP